MRDTNVEKVSSAHSPKDIRDAVASIRSPRASRVNPPAKHTGYRHWTKPAQVAAACELTMRVPEFP